MLSKTDYDRYLAAFNNRDYEGVLSFYGDQPVILFAGVVLEGRQAVRDFYAFFHSYVDERITVDEFAASETMIALEARVRLTAKRALDAATLADAGFPQLLPLAEGQVVEMRQYIHYHVTDGKLTSANCLVDTSAMA